MELSIIFSIVLLVGNVRCQPGVAPQGMPNISSLLNFGTNIVRSSIDTVNTAVNGGLDLVRSSFLLGSYLTALSMGKTAGVGHRIIAAAADVNEAALKGGANLVNQALDVAVNVTKEIPIVDGIVKKGAKLGQIGTGLVSDIGQTAVNTGAEMGATGLHVVEGGVRLGAGITGNVAHGGVRIAQSGVNTAANLAHAGLDVGQAVAQDLTGYIDSAIEQFVSPKE